MIARKIGIHYAWGSMRLEPIIFCFGPVVVLCAYAIFNALFIVKRSVLRELSPSAENSLLAGKRLYYWGVCLVAPFYQLFTRLRFTPNHVTILGFLLTACSAFVLIILSPSGNAMTLLWAGWLVCVGGIFDMIDGIMARLTGQNSLSGSYFDSVMDRFSEAVLFIGFAWVYRDNSGLILVLLAFTGAMVTSYSRAAGEKFGVTCKGGLMQRTERVLFLGAGAIVCPVLAAFLNAYKPQMFTYGLDLTLQIYQIVLLIVAVLSNFTAIQRTWRVFQALKEVPK